MMFNKFDENKEKFFRLIIAKDPTIEFSKHIEFDKISQNKKFQNNNRLIEWKLTNGDKFSHYFNEFSPIFQTKKTSLFL